MRWDLTPFGNRVSLRRNTSEGWAVTVSKGEQQVAVEDDIRIRSLRAEDIPILQAIDRKITKRVPTWKHVEMYIAGEPLLSFVAEHAGQIVGFLLGDVKSYEFGLAQSAWIEAMGVDPDFQRRGVARRLVQAFIERSRRTGISTVQTLIKEDDDDLQGFLRQIGFSRGEHVTMEKRT